MNRLTRAAPETVLVDEVAYPINTRHRACLVTIQCIESTELLQHEKADIVLWNMYGAVGDVPPNHAAAIQAALDFLSGGRERDGREHPSYSSFAYDSDMIYDAMLVKGVDLDERELHWWTFLSHYYELPESRYTHIVYLRMQHSKGKLTKEERRQCEQIGWHVIRMGAGAEEDPFLAFLRGEGGE